MKTNYQVHHLSVFINLILFCLLQPISFQGWSSSTRRGCSTTGSLRPRRRWSWSWSRTLASSSSSQKTKSESQNSGDCQPTPGLQQTAKVWCFPFYKYSLFNSLLGLILNFGGLDSWDQSRSRSRTSFVSRLTFLNCRDFLDGRDQLFFFSSEDCQPERSNQDLVVRESLLSYFWDVLKRLGPVRINGPELQAELDHLSDEGKQLVGRHSDISMFIGQSGQLVLIDDLVIVVIIFCFSLLCCLWTSSFFDLISFIHLFKGNS